MSWLTRLIGAAPLETRDDHVGPNFSIADAALAAYLRMGATALGELDAFTALRNPAYWRAVSLISSTIAALPLKCYRKDPETGERQEVDRSWITDNPAGPYGLTPYQWVEMVVAHLLTQGETGLLHVYSNGGALIGLWPVHPTSYAVAWRGGEKVFTITMQSGKVVAYDSSSFTQIMGLSLDGLRGISPISVHRRSLQLMHAQEEAALRSMTTGANIAGLVSSDEDISLDEAKDIKKGIDEKIHGPSHSNEIVMVNRKLKFTPWTMTHVDAQFLQSREFQVSEVARMFGIPAHLLMTQEKQTSWGTGIAEQNLALHRYTLVGWTTRIEQALSRLLPAPRYVEFDYQGMLQGTPEEETATVLAQLQGGLISVEYACEKLNLPVPAKGESFIAGPFAPKPEPLAPPPVPILALTDSSPKAK